MLALLISNTVRELWGVNVSVLCQAGVSILQENLNYSPALSVVYKILPQILPQLQSYRCLLTRSLDPSFLLFFCDNLLGGSITVPNAHFNTPGGMCPPQKLENFVFLKLESCNLVNTFGYTFEAGNE